VSSPRPAPGTQVPPYLIELAARNGIPVASTAAAGRHHVVVDGVRLHYLDWGNSGAPPLVLLHGGALTAHSWDLVALALRGRFHCLAPDLRGHGESEWPTSSDYRLEAYARDVASFVRALNVSPVGLVGNSLGGQVALIMAASSPELVRALVMVDVGDNPSPSGAAEVRAFIGSAEEFATLDDAVDHVLMFSPRRKAHVLRRSLRNNLRELSSGAWAWKYDSRAFRVHDDDVAMAHRQTVLRDAVGRVAVPTLAVRGGDSPVFSRTDAETLAATFIDGSWVEVPDAAHTVQGDNPAGLVAVLEPFLATVYG
jgi:esterase